MGELELSEGSHGAGTAPKQGSPTHRLSDAERFPIQRQVDAGAKYY